MILTFDFKDQVILNRQKLLRQMVYPIQSIHLMLKNGGVNLTGALQSSKNIL
jgi:hypothetical protein